MKLRKSVAISEAGLVFNPVTGESFTVNPIGIEILKLLQDGKEPGEISQSVVERYSIDPPTFEKDYQDFLTILEHYNLAGDEEETNA